MDIGQCSEMVQDKRFIQGRTISVSGPNEQAATSLALTIQHSFQVQQTNLEITLAYILLHLHVAFKWQAGAREVNYANLHYACYFCVTILSRLQKFIISSRMVF